MNSPRRFAIKDSGSTYNWQVIDTTRTSFEIIATCRTIEDARLVCNSLNFNDSPRTYGYVLKIDEDT